MVGLEVPSSRIYLVRHFLDSVQYDDGAQYGYQDPQPRQTTTAIGLLCRMYLGWKKDNPALERGVQWLVERGPAENDMYYNYYATQVMHQFGGELWKKCERLGREAEGFSRKDIEKGLGAVVAEYGAKGLAWAKVTAEGLTGSIAKFFAGGAGDKLRAALS